jgi:hypothetical protein
VQFATFLLVYSLCTCHNVDRCTYMLWYQGLGYIYAWGAPVGHVDCELLMLTQHLVLPVQLLGPGQVHTAQQTSLAICKLST